MRRMGMFAGAALCAMAIIFSVACDRDRTTVGPLPATPGNDPTHQSTEKSRPTTQELVNGPRRVILLGVLPFAVRAPESWEVKTMGENEIVTFLEGWAPHDEIKIQLTRQPTITAERVELTESGLRKEMAANPETFKLVNLREADGVKILEQQSVGRPNDVPVMDGYGKQVMGPDGQPMTSRQVDYRWKISVFVPAGKLYDVYELIFVGLTQAEFEADKSFLREIVDSIRHDESAHNASLLEAPKPKLNDRPAR